jgi:hypothetical protein
MGLRSTLSSEFNQYQFLGFVLDQQGVNDEPSQSDLNAFTRADNVTGKIGVKWIWDDVNSWAGTGQTGDACALFDTDNDTKANAAVCVRIKNPNGDPNVVGQLAAPESPIVYMCGNGKADRCTNGSAVSLGGTVCEVEKVNGETFFTAGDDGADVLAACSIPLAAISASVTPNLLNVCSFPSGVPNSNPFDCVVQPGAGFLIIKKGTDPQSSGETSSFTVSPAPTGGATYNLTDNTSSSEETALIPIAPGNYSVAESTIPTGWQLDAATCARQTTPTPTATGTKSGSTVSGISVTSGETTICTFTNSRIPVNADISVVKSADMTTISAQGGASVSGFTPDQSFPRGSGGGGGGSPIFTQVCDDGGPNDVPDQSDLNCFSRADNIAGRLWMRWSWDDVNAWTGSGQTGDACSLLDTDGDGNANFAFCVRINNPNGDANALAQASGSPILYKCGDDSPERCTSKTSTLSIDASTVCAVTKIAEHFTGVGDDGNDAQAECNLRLRDLGPTIVIADIDLVNVCSYPSGSPNSNNFDCVVTPGAGFLVITKTTTPANSDSYFGFRLRNAANTANATSTAGEDEWAVQGGATSAGIPILPGTYSLTELLPTNWVLDGIACTRDGNSVGTTSGNTRTGITIVKGQTTNCTYTNSLFASATVTFTVEVTNNGTDAVTLTTLEDTENPDAGTPTYATLNSVGTCVTGGSILGGAKYTCTFTRVVSGPPGTTHNDKVRATGTPTAGNADTKISNKVTVTITQ